MSTIQPSRRHVLAAFAAGAATLVLRPAGLRGAERARSDLKFIVVSDTHLGRQDKETAHDLWKTAAMEINAAAGAFVLHLGDVVDGGREAQYPVYLETRKLIQKPVYEIPGNHDPQALFQRHIRQDVDTYFDHDWLRVVLMNNSHTDSHMGFFTQRQLAWMSKTCDDAAERGLSLLLCAHVPLHSNKSPDRGWYVQPADGQAQAYAIVKKHEARMLGLFHGHFHNGIRGWTDHTPVHEIIFPSNCYNQDRKLEEKKAPGYNLPEFRAGYTLVHIHDGLMELQFKVTGVDAKVDKRLELRSGDHS